MRNRKRNGLLALSPLLTMVASFCVLSVFCGGFSKVPILIVFLITSVYALLTLRGLKLDERISIFSRGAADENMLLMVWIFILAGGFAHAAKGMGAIDAIVNVCLQVLPSNLLLPGMFVVACFVSLSVGTSVGTIVALVPIAMGLAAPTGIRMELFVGSVVSGAFFGDNLSFISDTTVVATRSLGCRMSDKFRTNLRVALPAALLTLAIFTFLGNNSTEALPASALEASTQGIDTFLLIIPYLAVLITALLGLNVVVVLMLGIVLTGIVGLSTGAYTPLAWFEAICSGIGSMGELVMVSMMAAGMLSVIRYGGGITWLLRVLTKRVSTPRGASLGIAALVSITNLYTANNTIAILSVGTLARDISERFSLDNRRTASILDIFSCVVQGMIPYGAQLLIAGGLAGIEPVSLVPYLFYPAILGTVTLIAIILVKPNGKWVRNNI